MCVSVPARVEEVHGDTTDGVGQLARPCAHRIGQSEDVGFVVSRECHPHVPRPRATAKDHARRSWVAAPQLHLAWRARDCAEAERLRETHGIALYSDAINRLGADLNALEVKPFVYFPDWGLSMPIAFLTGGTVAMTCC